MSEWKTMESAPKNGDTILGIDCFNRKAVVYWDDSTWNEQHKPCWLSYPGQWPYNPVKWTELP